MQENDESAAELRQVIYKNSLPNGKIGKEEGDGAKTVNKR